MSVPWRAIAAASCAGAAALMFILKAKKTKAKKAIYLAGPDVFLPEDVRNEVVKGKKEICSRYGFQGLFPMDNALDMTGLSAPEIGHAIFHANVSLMKQADIIVANLTPFRGPSGDPGTCYEVGFMFSSEKLCYAYCNDARPFPQRVLDSDAEKGHPIKRRNTDVDAQGHHLEKFDLMDNLMMHCSCTSSGGINAQAEEGEIDYDKLWTDLRLFEKCVKHAASKLGTCQQ